MINGWYFRGIYIDNEYNLLPDVVDGLQKWLPETKDKFYCQGSAKSGAKTHRGVFQWGSYREAKVVLAYN